VLASPSASPYLRVVGIVTPAAVPRKAREGAKRAVRAIRATRSCHKKPCIEGFLKKKCTLSSPRSSGRAVRYVF
jgi:hypothetical protein